VLKACGGKRSVRARIKRDKDRGIIHTGVEDSQRGCTRQSSWATRLNRSVFSLGKAADRGNVYGRMS